MQVKTPEYEKQFYTRIANYTDITFSNKEPPRLTKDLKYNMSYEHNNWIETLALEAVTAVTQLPTAEQDDVCKKTQD